MEYYLGRYLFRLAARKRVARELGVPRSTLYEKGIARLRKIFEDRGLHEYLARSDTPARDRVSKDQKADSPRTEE